MEEHTSKRAQIKELRAKMKAELKDCKNRKDREAIEAKYAELERLVRPESIPVAPEAPLVDIVWSVKEVPLSDKQLKREKKRKTEEDTRELMRDATKHNKIHNEKELASINQHIANYRQSHGISPNLRLISVPSDGSCLFSAVGLSVNCPADDLRSQVAGRLMSHREDYEPYVEEDYDTYVQSIARDAWGGELELRVMSDLLGRAIVVFRSSGVLVIGEQLFNQKTAVLVSYHLHQFSSPHYNAVGF